MIEQIDHDPPLVSSLTLSSGEVVEIAWFHTMRITMPETPAKPTLEDRVRRIVTSACFEYHDGFGGTMTTRKERRERAVSDAVESIMKEIATDA